jgi:chromatin remodeling complex protein RSC6
MSKEGKANSAFMKPVQPDDALSKIVGSNPLPRTELTKKLWEYIKKNNLQNKKQIKADAALEVVFNGKKEVDMFELTRLVNTHIVK